VYAPPQNVAQTHPAVTQLLHKGQQNGWTDVTKLIVAIRTTAKAS
jgi:hypothetical protein